MEKIISQVLNSSIESCLLKEARDWDDLTLEEQRDYLKKHPKSKKRLTAQRSSVSAQSESKVPRNLYNKKDCERYFSHDQLDQVMSIWFSNSSKTVRADNGKYYEASYVSGTRSRQEYIKLTKKSEQSPMSRELRENIRRDPEKYPTEQLQAAIDLTDHAIEVMEEDPMSEGAPTDEIASSWKRKDRRIEIELENRERKEQQKPASSNLDALKKQLDKAREEYEEEDADLQRGTSSELIEHNELKKLLDGTKEEYETEKSRGAYDKEDIELLRKRYEDLKQKYDDEEEDIKRGASPAYKKLEALKKKMDEAKKKYDEELAQPDKKEPTINTDAKSIMKFDFKLWRKLGASDRDTLDQNWDKYVAAIKKAIPKGTTISKETIKELENENHHAMLAALNQLGRINF